MDQLQIMALSEKEWTMIYIALLFRTFSLADRGEITASDETMVLANKLQQRAREWNVRA